MSRGDNYISKESKCPFYKYENRSAIYCKGFSPETSIKLSFTERSKEYKRSFCRSKRWEECEIAKMLSNQEEP